MQGEGGAFAGPAFHQNAIAGSIGQTNPPLDIQNADAKAAVRGRSGVLPLQLPAQMGQLGFIHARAIIGNPEIILADEPTGNLDSKMGTEVMDLLRQLNSEDGRTIVMVTHNNDQAKLTSRTIRMFDGHQIG